MDFPVVTLAGKQSGSITLSDEIFGLEPRADILHRMVCYQLSKRRLGTHEARGRGDVSRTTAKIYKQKGGGRARHGSRKAPLFRGGGKAHGPVQRSHEIGLPKKVRALALKHALSSKVRGGAFVIIDDIHATEYKTAIFSKCFKDMGWTSVLLVKGGEGVSDFLRASVRNIPGSDLLPLVGMNVYDILRCKTLVLTRDAAEQLEARFG